MTTTTERREPVRLNTGYFGTEHAGAHFGDRLGKCYELAARAITDGYLNDATLVHGTIHGEGAPQRISHAWVEIEVGTERVVWEPITGHVYSRPNFYVWADAEVERTYAPDEMRVQMLLSGHFGRWHESEHP